MRLFWHQRDLRLQDNVGLAAAARDDDVVPVYVYDTDLLATVGKRQRAFFLRGVSRLREDLRGRPGPDQQVAAGLAVGLPEAADTPKEERPLSLADGRQ